MTASGKRKALGNESADSRNQRNAQRRSARIAKRQRTIAQVGDASEELQSVQASARLHRIAETAARNAHMQKKLVLAKAEAKKSRTRERVRRYASQQDRDRSQFFDAIDEPMTFICGSCGELANPRRMTVVEYNKNDTIFQTLATPQTVIRPDGLIPEAVVRHKRARSVPFCETCMASLKQRKPPRFCAAAGFSLATIPEELAVLNSIESRMIGLGICFTSCYNLIGDGQECSKGNAINFWNNAYRIVTTLPRPVRECGVVRLRAKGDPDGTRLFEVRPNLVRRALLWLREHNPLYAEVVISEDVLEALNETLELPVLDLVDDGQVGGDSIDTNRTAQDLESVSPSDELFHMSGENPTNCTETERIREKLCVEIDGPTTAINEYTSKTMIQCCFPVLFPDGLGGHFPLDDENRMYSYDLAPYFAHLMAWHDRRFVMHRNFKFFCLNLVQRRQIDGLTRQIRSRPLRDQDYNGDGDGDDDGSRAKRLLRELKPYFRVVRGSGLYWSEIRDQLMALIGNEVLPTPFPTFFFTLSAADTVWPDFFCACNSQLSLDDAAHLSAAERRRYLNENPDIASRHFFRRFKAFFDHIICGEDQPLGEIVDYFWRVEFQKRGSPHIHGLLWVRDAPDVLKLSETATGRQELEQFVDKYISADCKPGSATADCSCTVCCKIRADPELDILSLRPPLAAEGSVDAVQCDLARVAQRVQQHMCFTNSRCRVKSGQCRFHFPKPLRDATAVTVEKSDNGAIRLNVECRRPDPNTNNYNEAMLSVWRANMDIKLVGNAYGAAEYTAAYVSKSEPDTTKFRDMINRALAKCSDDDEHHHVLRRVANATLAAREVSAQEALWILQNGLPMYGKSRQVQKIKTSPHAKRYYRVDIATCRRQLENDGTIDEDSHEIRIDPLEAAYMARPVAFDDMTYRHFAENYEPDKGAAKENLRLERWPRRDGKGFIKARRSPQAIAKTPRVAVDPTNADYCFSEIFLRIPWRTLEDLPASKQESLRRFDDLRKTVVAAAIQIDTAVNREEQLQLLATSEVPALRLPQTEWSMGRENSELPTQLLPHSQGAAVDLPPSRYSLDDIKRAEDFVATVVRPYVKSRRETVSQNGNSAYYTKKQYLYPIGLVEGNMNTDQWSAFAVCMRQSRARRNAQLNRTDCEPMRMIINGEGGCGKSWLIRHVVKDIHHVFNDLHIKTRYSKRVMLMAHHGTAAFNIKGTTICSALSIPRMTKQGYDKPYERLSETRSGSGKLRTLQDQYASVHMVILDEYSVVSCAMLHWIDQRMREIWPSCHHLPFGGRDVILVGDLGQLSPVTPAALFTPEQELENGNQKMGRQLWESIKCVCNLTSQTRGKLDPEWYEALSRLRRMEETSADVRLFNTRHGAPMTVSSDTKFIAYKNDDVDEANASFLRRQPERVFHISSMHSVEPTHGDAEVSEAMRRAAPRLLEAAATPDRDRDRVIRPSIDLAVGVPVSLTYNLEQQAGLCNGTKAVVRDFMIRPGCDVPIVLVEILDKYIGPSFFDDRPNIVPVIPQTITWTSKSVKIRTRRTGLPLRLAYAMMVHKVQGLTCPTLIFDPTGIPTSAFAYVGLSRVRHRNHLVLSRALQLKATAVQTKTKTQLLSEWSRLEECSAIHRTNTQDLVCHYQQVAEMENTQSVRFQREQ